MGFVTQHCGERCFNCLLTEFLGTSLDALGQELRGVGLIRGGGFPCRDLIRQCRQNVEPVIGHIRFLTQAHGDAIGRKMALGLAN